MGKRDHVLRDIFDTVSLGAPEHAVGFVLWRVLHRYIREVDRALGPVDLTHLQFTTLAMAAWLGRLGDEVTQAELARSGDIHPMQVSHMLKSLEIKGLIARTRSASDTRAKYIELTGMGVKALRRSLPLVVEVQREMFGKEGAVGGNLLSTLLRLEEEAEKRSGGQEH
jgi:MarR family transcriptional regulator, organic hydroperoxide resistance regulator